MGRLIDIDEYCKEHCIKNCSESQRSACSIAMMPTAFDVKAVVKELEKLADRYNDKILNFEHGQYYDGAEDGIRNAIEVVRRGGVK